MTLGPGIEMKCNVMKIPCPKSHGKCLKYSVVESVGFGHVQHEVKRECSTCLKRVGARVKDSNGILFLRVIKSLKIRSFGKDFKIK